MDADTELTNADVLHYWKTQKHSVSETLNYVTMKLGRDEFVNVTSFRTSLNTIEKKRKHMQKTKSLKPQLEQFLASPYILPERRQPQATGVTQSDNSEVEPPLKKNKGLLECECETLKEVNTAICKELNEVKLQLQESEGLSKQVDTLSKKVSEYTPKRVNQKLKRKHFQLEKKNEVIETLKKENRTLLKAVNKQDKDKKVKKPVVSTKKVTKSKKYVKRVRSRQKKTTRKTKEVEDCCRCNVSTKIIWDMNKKIQEQRQEILDLQNEKCTFLQKIEEIQSELVITKLDGKTYTDEMRECIYHCSCKNVAIDNMEDVITFILAKLGNKTVSEFPDDTSCRRIVREMGEVSRQHVSQALDGVEHTTIKYDGTSKAKQHWVEAQIASRQKTYTIGVQKSAAGGANDYSEMIKDKIDSLGSAGQARTGVNNSDRILNNITNSMTDRHIVNKKANTNIMEMKENAVLNTFYCAVHPLDTFAQECVKVTKKWEEQYNVEQGKTFVYREASQTNGLIYAIAKMFHQEGAGVPGEIDEFLRTKGILKNLVEYHVGQRFHILFHNAGSIYYLKEYILEFLTKVWGAPNRLLQAIKHDLAIPTIIDIVRALGLVGKFVTGPWLKFASQEKPILAMNDFYERAVENLAKWELDAQELMSGSAILHEDVIAEKDAVLESLLKPTDRDETVCQVVQKLCSSILTVCRRQLADQLAGGKFSNPTTDLLKEAQSCNSNNISGERVFAKLDASVRRAPSAKMDYHESRIIFSENNTSAWLAELEPHDRSEVIAAARKGARQEMRLSRKKEYEMRKKKGELLTLKRNTMAEKEVRTRMGKENMLHDFHTNGGLWTSVSQMNTNLQKIRGEIKKKNAVKNQIKVRKTFLSQVHEDQSVFSFSKNRKQLTLRDLQNNLVLLMEANCIGDDEETNNINMCLRDPKVLEKKHISHKWVEESGSEKWYDGFIDNIVTTSKVLEFKVTYYGADEDEVVYLEFDEIVTDLKGGDLIVLW